MAPDLEKSLVRTEEFLDGQIEGANRRLLRSLERLERRIVKLASALEVDAAGRIKGPKWTLRQAQKIHKQLAKEFAAEFGEAVRSNVGKFDTVAAFVEAQFADLDVPASFSKVDREVIGALKTQAFEVYEGMSIQAQNRVAQAVYDAVVAGDSFTRLEAQIAAALVGHKDVKGRPLSRYADVYAQDALMEFYSTLHHRKALDVGLDRFVYYGDIIRGTRPFCRTRAGKVYTAEEVEAWSKLRWSGKKPGSIWITRGGYNCRHHFHAVREEWLPEGEIEVAVFRKGEKKVQRGKAKPKTVAEAEDKIRALYPRAKVDLEGMAPEVAASVAEGLEKAVEKFPFVADALGGLEVSRLGGSTYGQAWMDLVTLNDLHHGNAAKLGKNLARDVKSLWHPIGTEAPGSVAVHEVGHTVFNAMRFRWGSKSIFPSVPAGGEGTLYRIADDLSRSMLRGAKRGSQYAHKNTHEAFAESFAEIIYTPPERWSQWAQGLNAVLETVRDMGLHDGAMTHDVLERMDGEDDQAFAGRVWEEDKRLKKEYDKMKKRIRAEWKGGSK